MRAGMLRQASRFHTVVDPSFVSRGVRWSSRVPRPIGQWQVHTTNGHPRFRPTVRPAVPPGAIGASPRHDAARPTMPPPPSPSRCHLPGQSTPRPPRCTSFPSPTSRSPRCESTRSATRAASSARRTSNGATTTTFAAGSAQLAGMAASPSRSGSFAPSSKKGSRTSSSLSTTVPSAPPWRGSRTGATTSDRTRVWAVRRRRRFFMDDVPPTAAGASSRGRGTRQRAPVRRHGRRPGSRLERDWTLWPRLSGARGTWRRSRSDGASDWRGSEIAAAPGRRLPDVQKERRTVRFRCHWNPQSDGRTGSRRVALPWNRVGKVAVFDGRLSMDRYSRPPPK
jgi:hypothetical protein